MTELTEKEHEQLNTARTARAEADVLMPLLDTKVAMVLGRIVAAFRAGDTAKLLPLAAELATIYDMKTMITQQIGTANYLEKKMLTEGET